MKAIKELKNFILLWSTQSLSQLGSAMTNFALVIYLYEKTGSALQTALLSICSYAPYVVMSIFAGALSDRWDKRKVMLVCDVIAAMCTVAVFVLIHTDLLMPWHMYVLNALNGLMNTVQQPASDVSMSLITPKEYYQKTSGMRSFTNSLVTILTPVIATVSLSFFGIGAVILVDLITFLIAFLVLLFFIRIPEVERDAQSRKEPILQAAKGGLHYLNENRLVLKLILFLAGINFVSSAFNATLPAMILPRANGGELVLGTVQSCAGIATLVGSLSVTLMPAPKNRVRVICVTLLISMSTENFILAFCHTPFMWCVGQIFGWLVIPLMGANLDVVLRTNIPVHMQGRVFSCRNTLQFFTIPIGNFLGGFLTDEVFEPLMARQSVENFLSALFGVGKGSGASMMLGILGITGVMICLVFWYILRKEIIQPENNIK